MKPKNPVLNKAKIGNIPNQRILQGINTKYGQNNKVTLNNKRVNYKLGNNISRETDYLFTPNLIIQGQQKEYNQNNNNFDNNNPYIDKGKINYRHPKDNNNANKAHQRPESGVIILRRDYEENPLANNNIRNNIDIKVSLVPH